MISLISSTSIQKIKNSVFRAYADKYNDIYKDFMLQISQLGLEIDQVRSDNQVFEKINRLVNKGACVRNDMKSITVNSISPSCEACRTGEGSATFFISLRCHRNCFYCFNPNQENYEYYLTHQRRLVDELQQIARQGGRLDHIALTGGEPLLYKEETLNFFKTARHLFPNSRTRLYTSGDHLDLATLNTLRDVGLDEIRLSIRMHDLDKGHRFTYKQLATSLDYIPSVMVEMPVLPGTLDGMKKVLLELEKLGIEGINLLEFCFPVSNSDEFQKRGYKIKPHPFRILYNYWYAGGLPVSGSEEVCLDLIDFALENKLKLGVHYCSLENKHSGQVYQQNAYKRIPKTAHFSEKDFFIKTAKVFGSDIYKIKPILIKSKGVGLIHNAEYNYLEFNPIYIPLLKGYDIEIGIASCIFEQREDGEVMRELAIDLTTPETFNISIDL